MKLFLTLCMASIYLFATPQAPNTVIIDGTHHLTHTCPLYSYLADRNITVGTEGQCSACWKGYTSSFVVEDGEIYITRVTGCTCPSDDKAIPLKKFFPDLQGGRVKAVWFTGTVTISEGKVVNYGKIDYEPIHGRGITYEFKKGQLVGKSVVRNRSEAEKFLSK